MAERVIWERIVDHDKIRDRGQRFRKRFFIPATLIVAAVLIFAGWQNAIGVMIVIAIIGLMWGMTVRYKSLSDAANPVMTVASGRLVVGDRKIILEDVTRFTTLATSIQTSFFGKHSRVHIAKAIFRMDVPGSRGEPELHEIGWPNMTEQGLDGVTEAVKAELPRKWVEPHELVDQDEMPKRSRSILRDRRV